MSANDTLLWELLAQAAKKRQAVALCTVISSQGSTPRGHGSKMLVYADGKIAGTVGGGELENRVRKSALQAIQDGKPQRLDYKMNDPAQGDPGICGGQVEVFVEPFLPAPAIVVLGAGHVGKAVAHLAKWLGYYVVVSDDRAEFCNSAHIPDADSFFPVEMSALPTHLTIDEQTYLVLATRGSDVDIVGLPALLKTSAAYIGIIGSHRRWQLTRNALTAQGVTEEALNRVHSPIGLELQAETPEEIALSIMSEILMVRNQADGKHMKKK